MVKKIQAVVFDCDGVMFDTVRANQAYYNQILNHFGIPDMTPEQFNYANMHTSDNVLAFFFQDQEMLEAAHAYRKSMNYFPLLKFIVMEPYLKPLLKKIRPEYKIAIATNRTDTIGRVLKEFDLDRYFDLVVCAQDVEHPKPHPDQLIKILNHFKIGPREAIYVGDSELDELAAKAAGIPLIAYNNQALSADFHIKSLKEIEDILKG